MVAFKSIILSGRPRADVKDFIDTFSHLKKYLLSQHCDISIENETAKIIKEKNLPCISLTHLTKNYDLLIVVGGDGSMLNTARAAAEHKFPVLGINRGRLGFLADIVPEEMEKKLHDILAGHYLKEERFLLQASIEHKGQLTPLGVALNDIVLFPGHIAHMIEFAIYIDEQLVCAQRADGLITSTPTGSTAYALSGGGPILHPRLDALVMVPMFPHTFSSRPIVVDGNSKIKIVIDPNIDTSPHVAYDGHRHRAISPGDILHICKFPKQLTLIHPVDYNYYETLRSKLGWQKIS